MWLEYLQPWCSEKTQCTLRSQTRLLGDIFVLTQLFLVFTKEQKLLWYALWIGKAAYYPLKNKHPDTEHAYSRTPPQCHGAWDCTAHQAPPEQNLSRGHPHLYPLLSHPSNLCLSANPLFSISFWQNFCLKMTTESSLPMFCLLWFLAQPCPVVGRQLSLGSLVTHMMVP